MRPLSRALLYNGGHGLNYINRKHRYHVCMGNTERFTGRVDTYERYRQRYPTDEVLQRLRTWCGLQPTWTIADIGAGTGMSSEVFLANGNPVLAVEPNDEMRSACARLTNTWPHLRVLKATAEETSLPDASIDMVVAGRAFHWFDIPRSLAEFRRILKPNGWVTLISQGRAHDETPQCLDFEALLTTYGIDYEYRRAGYRIQENLREVFPADLHQAQIESAQSLDWKAFLGQTQSLSVVPRASDPRSSIFNKHLRRYFETYAIDNILTTPTTCWISSGHL